MFGRPGIALLNAASRAANRNARTPASFRIAGASSSSSKNSSPPHEPPVNDESSGSPKTSVVTTIEPKPFIPLYHHEDLSLFPPLVPGSLSYIIHNVSSAFNAVVTLATSQEARDKFMSLANLNNSERVPDDEKDNLYNGCIINTNVIGQADMGFIKVLALFDGLNSPLYDTEGSTFDIKDFMDGAGFALNRFQEVGREHMKVLSGKLAEGPAGESFPYDFLDVAMSDPDSLEHDLMEMTTPTYWMIFNDSLKEIVNAPSFLIEALKKGTPAESKITHLALLSARVAAIEKPPSVLKDTENGNDDPNAPLEDDSLAPHIERSDSKTQIVTQIEVLYESEVTFPDRDLEGDHLPGGFQTKMVVDVATFEACIAGDPNGALQWRLSQTRPAIEFGYGVGFISLNTK